MSDELINAIPRKLYIGGKWVPSSDGAEIEVRDPATEQIITTIASGSAEDALAAVDAAAAGWAQTATRDVGRGMAVADRIDAGIMGLNRGFVSDPAAPFGGMKQSGLGREGSHEGIREFLETKYIAMDW